jgi:WD40-like Beta Propeller Repeat
MKHIGCPAARHWWVATLGLIGVMLALTYVFHVPFAGHAPLRSDLTPPVTSSSKSPSAVVMDSERPALLFRSTTLGDAYGRLAFVSLDHPDSSPAVSDMRCDRVYFAAGRGVCLTARRGVSTTYESIIFDAAFQRLFTVSLRGTPSRVRVSADGRVAAITVFVSGHSYAAAGFSTHTSMIDLQTGEFIVPDLEKFTVWRDGERFQGVDFNFWGVTFQHDRQRFYATLGSGGRTYLIEGEVTTQTAWVRRSDLECPALSPDGTRLAFKKRVGSSWGPVLWRLAVFDLATKQEWLLAETRSIDDQAEWLDDASVLYAVPDQTSRSAAMHTWEVPADGSGAPRLFAAQGYSPVVVRPWPSQHPWSQTVLQ